MMEVYCHLVNTKDIDKFVDSPVINQSFWTDELGQTVQIKTGRIEDSILIRLLNFFAVARAYFLQILGRYVSYDIKGMTRE